MDERTQSRSGQLWHKRRRDVEGQEDRRASIRLDLRLMLLGRHLADCLVIEMGRSCRVVVVRIQEEKLRDVGLVRQADFRFSGTLGLFWL